MTVVGVIVSGALTVTVTVAFAVPPALSVTRTVELPAVEPAVYCPVVAFTLAPLAVFATRLNV